MTVLYFISAFAINRLAAFIETAHALPGMMGAQ